MKKVVKIRAEFNGNLTGGKVVFTCEGDAPSYVISSRYDDSIRQVASQLMATGRAEISLGEFASPSDVGESIDNLLTRLHQAYQKARPIKYVGTIDLVIGGDK